MSHTIRFVLALHNHQPVGNFDGVFEQAYEDSYLPFLEVFESYPSLPISLHTSGSLMEWLVERHPEYVDRLARLVTEGRVEILGGAYYEAILPMIPPRDRIGQIRQYSEWLQARFGVEVRGMWVPERVWEQSPGERPGRRRHPVTRSWTTSISRTPGSPPINCTAITSPKTTASWCRSFPAASSCVT